MPDETNRGRGRSKKVVESETSAAQPSPDTSYEFNSYFENIPLQLSRFFDYPVLTDFTPEEVRLILSDPIENHNLARRLSQYVYNSEGTVTNAIDYMVSMPCLDRVICGKKKAFVKKKMSANKDLMLSTLEAINDKQFIRDALFTDMVDGTCFYYFETKQAPVDRTKYLQDYDVESIIELCDIGMNATMISLPYEYCKIIGRKNGRPIVAFNLDYFLDLPDENAVNRKLKQYPEEIRNAWEKRTKGNATGNWVVLDSDHTIAHKIKCKASEPWGRPIAIAAIPDILYQNEFVDTKRNVLNNINSQVIVQTFPASRDGTTCTLSKAQQENQHKVVKDAVLNKKNKNGTTFVSVAAGTKLDSLDIANTDIFDEKNEKDLTDKIAMDLGMAAQLLGATSTGTFAGGQHNLEMVNAQIYSWIQEIQAELNYVINACVIKDRKNKVEVYYLPTSLVNRKSFFEYMKSLYLEAGGSLTFLVAATGVSPEAYFNVLDEEIGNKIFDRYEPHKTSYTLSKSDTINKGGRPEEDNPTENTLKSRNNNGNNIPSPSDN